ncbi:amidohydrolase family protein [Thermoleptolyngbya sichuanensis A183]|uniref:Amidohydrolase family protein n=1 Tax=Thermoleptolyngbya sichuanensis A183 TaxID=2737172 RepID=A0A6M8BFR9_9CYAN|nr:MULTISPECIES: amidohydrolase family protein [Thermoleptolyngbya]QKD81425.1 amidohydrolase family protein [Thermoleptolyngbya sichuanensis A183]
MGSRFRYSAILGVVLLILIGLATQVGWAQSQPAVTLPNPGINRVLFQNVRVFDGTSPRLSGPTNVLVIDNKIERISTSPIPVPADLRTLLINGEGKVLMPGLIDAHVHLFLEGVAGQAALFEAGAGGDALVQQVFRAAAESSTQMLMNGFTSARDMAGPVFDLKKAIDQGQLAGPRLWPSGAMISQTSGHGDFRTLDELLRTPTSELSLAERYGVGAIADGVPEVLRATREQLMRGATQIKLAAGGGVASVYDPLDVSQYTEDEFRAAVDAAADWNTYVTVHAYTPRAIQTAIRAGVKCIEHGQLMDEPTARLMTEKGVWLSMQPFLDDEDANPYPEGSESRRKQLQVAEGTDISYGLAKKYNIKTAWGTDILYDPAKTARRGRLLSKMVRWYTPAEVLKMATHDNAELLAMSGPRNPYPGKLGVVEEGALADLLLVNGDPLENIRLIDNPAENFLVIMKDGKIYKNLLS